jgi:tetratricopeptide (TPR) repeat protein
LKVIGVEDCVVQPDGLIGVENLGTDFRQLLAACEKRDLDTIEKLSGGVFLSGLERKVKATAIRDWMKRKEALRVSSLWEAFLHLIYLGRIPVSEVNHAYRLAKDVPDKKDTRFIYLYDLLKKHHLLSGDIGKRMLEVIALEETKVGDGSLESYVEHVRETFVRNKDWKTPLELWGDSLVTSFTLEPTGVPVSTPLPETNQSPPPVPEQVESEPKTGSLNEHKPIKAQKWLLWFPVASLSSLAVLWLVLWSFMSYANTRGTVLIEAGEHSQALSYLQIAQSINRLGFQRATVSYNLANALESLGRYDEAKAYYQEAMRLDSNFPAPYNNLSRLLIAKEKNPQEALAWLDRAYELVEADATLTEVKGVILKNRAWARYEVGNYQTAQRDIDQALSLSPAMAASHCLAALLSEARGEDGLEHWESCVAYDVGETMIEANWRDLAQERLRP